MKILVALDQSPHSVHAVNEVARLARNTLANVTMVGVVPRQDSRKTFPPRSSKQPDLAHPLVEMLHDCRERFLGHFDSEDSPYISKEFGFSVVEGGNGAWDVLRTSMSARKELKTRIRVGSPVKEILAEAREQECDLIVLPYSTGSALSWENDADVPQEIANSADCSVLVTKEETMGKRVVCCLDQNNTTQQSLEMINQMVTLYGADLEIAGVTEGDGHGLEDDVYRKMNSVLKYYHDRQIYPFIKVVPVAGVAAYVSEEARQSLMALWMGKDSILEKNFPRSKVNWLVKTSGSSVLLLR